MTRATQRWVIVIMSFLTSGLYAAHLNAATREKINASYGAISGSMLPIWVTKEARLFESTAWISIWSTFPAALAASCR